MRCGENPQRILQSASPGRGSLCRSTSAVETHCSTEGTHELDKSLLFLRRQPQGLHERVKMGIALATSIIKVQNSLEAGQGAIVHVRCGLGNLAQSRCLESPPIFHNACQCFAAFVGETASIPPDTQIVE